MFALPRTLSKYAVLAFVLGFSVTAQAQEVRLNAPGLDSDLADRMRANSLLFREPEEGTARTGQDIVAAAQADYGRLIGILYEAGYFAPVIEIQLDGREASAISPFAPPAQVQRAVITIRQGPAFRLGRAEIGPLDSNTQLPAGFAPGEPATTPLLRATTEAALAGWRARGHATAEVADQRIVARNREAIMDVAITIEPGPLVRFGALLPEGQERMRRARILEIAGLPTGEIYSPAALARAEERLRDTGVFSAVSLQLDDPGPDGTADVTALLSEAPLRRLGAGAELSSDEGLRLTGYWIHRNLLGGAERLRLDAEVSGIRDATTDPDFLASATYTRPATFTPDTALELSTTVFRFDERLYLLEGIDLQAGLIHRLTDTIEISGGVGLSLLRAEDAFGARNWIRLTLPLGATYDNRDDALDTRAGAYADVTLTPFFTVDGEPGVRTTIDGRGYLGFGAENRSRLAARVQIGSVVGGDIRDIPPDELFLSGGSGTVRGQAYQSLGAVQNGQNSGGRAFLGLSGEFRQDIGETNLGLVGFVDAGYVAADAFGSGNSEWHAGAGLGVRYTTPFGPIRVDLATPIRGGGIGEDLYLYIGIGHAF